MVFAEDIRKIILKLAEEKGPEKTFGPSDIASRVGLENPDTLIEQIYFVASVLVKEGKITTPNPGEPDQLNTRYQLQFKKVSRAY